MANLTFKTGAKAKFPETKTPGQLSFITDGATGSIYLDIDANNRVKFNADAKKLDHTVQINDTNFDGSSSIRTNSWGWNREFKIGNYTLDVDGSQEKYEWSLKNIGISKKYASFATPSSNSWGWYTIATITDNATSPAIFFVRAYAHSSIIFTVSKGYNTTGSLNVLDYNASANQDYAAIAGARLMSDGRVQIYLRTKKTSDSTQNALVDVEINAINSSDTLTIANTLVADDTTNPSVIITRNCTVTGNIIGNLQGSASSLRDRTNGTETYLNYGAEGISSTSWFAAWNGYELRGISPVNSRITMSALSATSANGYYGMGAPDGNVQNWIRTTEYGIIPYQSGGCSSLGTDSWPFNNIYTNNLISFGPIKIGNNGNGDSNYIAFYGTTGDGPGSYNHTFIGENLYGGNEGSELVLFKGNDIDNNSGGSPGPDRIRHIAACHLFQTYDAVLSGTWTTICDSTVPVTKLEIKSNIIYSYNPIKLGNSTASSQTEPSHYFSAGTGYGTTTGLNGLKILVTQQDNCHSGFGQDLTGKTYELAMAAGLNTDGSGNITFSGHTMSNLTSYREAGGFTFNSDNTHKFYITGQGTLEVQNNSFTSIKTAGRVEAAKGFNSVSGIYVGKSSLQLLIAHGDDMNYAKVNSSNTSGDINYIKGAIKLLCANNTGYGGLVLGQYWPNSQGPLFGHIYSTSDINASTGLPRYSTFIACNLGNSLGIFGTNDFNFYSKAILDSSNYSSYALPLSGGTMNSSAVIKFTNSAGTINTSDPMAITYGRISSFGTIWITADTDGSQTEYVVLTAGRGVSSNINDGLAVGYSTLKWQGNNVLTAANYSSYALPLSGGTMTGLITGKTQNTSWIGTSRNGAFRTETAASGGSANAVISMKTNTGAWGIANLTGSDNLYFVFGTDANYSAGTNTTNNYYLNTSGYFSGSCSYANSAGSVAWGNVTGKPSTFAPSSHTHSYLPLAGGSMTGAISITTNGVTNSFYSQNSSYTHYSTTASVGHWFNKSVYVQGEIYAGSSYNQKVYHMGNIIYSSTQPTSASTGTIWLKPV